jgi:hypothetical protein
MRGLEFDGIVIGAGPNVFFCLNRHTNVRGLV